MIQSSKVVVLGAGVLGLSIAKELAERGIQVSVVARDLPEDLESAAFASPWAGANWSSFADSSSSREARWDTITFHRFAQLAKSHPDVVARKQFKRVWNDPKGYPPPWFKDLVFDFRRMNDEDLPQGFKYGETYECYTMSPPAYLAYLASELASHSVPLTRARLSSLDEAYTLPDIGPVDLVINATGLGSRSLLGVEDHTVYPIRGDTVLVRAPGVNSVYKVLDKSKEDIEAGKRFYIIPRPGPEHHVILGGTELDDDWDTLPRPFTIERILKDAYNVCPQLSDGKGWKEIDVVSCNVGLRPARKGAARVELEYRTLGQVGASGAGLVPKVARGGKGRRVGVVHAYGIGPAGFQSSKGVSQDVAELVCQFFAEQKGDSVNGLSEALASQEIK